MKTEYKERFVEDDLLAEESMKSKEKALAKLIKQIHDYCVKYKCIGCYNQEYENKLISFYVKE